jgi:hypothetical protein
MDIVIDWLFADRASARILGFDESPPAHRLSTNDVDTSGVNFATARAGAYDMLSRQIDQLSRLVTRGTIEDRDLDHSVALIAFNGARDYASVTITTSSDQVTTTTSICIFTYIHIPLCDYINARLHCNIC